MNKILVAIFVLILMVSFTITGVFISEFVEAAAIAMEYSNQIAMIFSMSAFILWFFTAALICVFLIWIKSLFERIKVDIIINGIKVPVIKEEEKDNA